jgi:GTP-binding protein
MPKPIVALVGRPNVGKSTLFNRLAGERLAVVDEVPGTTRDRLVAEAEWNGVQFDIVDTGGLDPRPLPPDAADFLPQVKSQAEQAVREADAVLLLVDVIAGVNALDHEVSDVLRRWQITRGGSPHPPILLVVNKADNASRRDQAIEFYELGLGEPIPISAKHGTGTGELLDRLVEALGRLEGVPEQDESRIKIAIVGRPNVGKSSLLNQLLGEERVIVSPVPGTTRDAIDTYLEFEQVPLTLIDTAGIRRRGRIKPGVEKYSVLRALRAIERADVCTLLIDALEGVTAQDSHIAGMILEKMRSVVLLVNKWDAVVKDSYTMQEYSIRIREQLRFLDYVPVLFISALLGTRVDQVLPTALLVHQQRLQRISTGQLNRILLEAQQAHAPPSKAGIRLKLFYGSQVRVDPPTFVFHVNDPEIVHFSYERFLENRIREAYEFLGTPIRLSFRKRGKDR